MIPKIEMPNVVNIPDAGIEIRNVHNTACLYCNGHMVGTLDKSQRGYHLSIDDKEGNSLEAVFTSIEKVLSFLVARKGNYTDVR